MLLDDYLINRKNICILGHINPDGDCICSTLSIYNYIKNKYFDEKIAQIYLDNPNDKFSFLNGFDKISTSEDDSLVYDLAIVCDCSSRDRIKNYLCYLDNAKNVLIIDHHETNEFEYKNMIIGKYAPATCQMIYRILDKQYINEDIAKYIYLGVAHDTGVFRYSNTNKETFDIVSQIMNFKFDFTCMLDKTIFMQSLQQKKIKAMIINRAETFREGKIIFGYVTQKEHENFGLDKKDIDIVVVDLRETVGVELAIFMYELKTNVYKVSLRSNGNDINCAEISKKFNGGVHKKGAGFTINGNINEIKQVLQKLI